MCGGSKRWQCNYCGLQRGGAATRIKDHLAIVPNKYIGPCDNVPTDVKASFESWRLSRLVIPDASSTEDAQAIAIADDVTLAAAGASKRSRVALEMDTTEIGGSQTHSSIKDKDNVLLEILYLQIDLGRVLHRYAAKIPGQSKEANSTVLDLLKCYVSEHKGKWEQYLPLVEYAYNNTGKAPFEIVEGGKKVPPILHTKDKIFEAHNYLQNMDEMYKKVKVALEKTQAKQKKAADHHRREVVFLLGDWVLLRFEKARLKKMKGKERLFPKLNMRYYGPFQICDIISDVACRLKLPESWKIHNAFHIKDKDNVLLEILYLQIDLGRVLHRYAAKIPGQSKEANSTVLDLLKCYVSEHKGKWEQYLPLVEYAYNNTGKAPFEIVEGGKKVPPILHTKDKIFEAHNYLQNMDEMYKKVKVALEKTQAKQKKAADHHRREVVFLLGDWVLLRFEKARLKKMKGKERLFPKLNMRYYGPFQICDIISDVACRLKLPESWKIHNAFHA
ncbi:hypothetical protein L7F22_049003 [Adiantum nelumboides]|nr:hypothetical protein [Adiantum nelumboides]